MARSDDGKSKRFAGRTASDPGPGRRRSYAERIEDRYTSPPKAHYRPALDGETPDETRERQAEARHQGLDGLHPR